MGNALMLTACLQAHKGAQTAVSAHHQPSSTRRSSSRTSQKVLANGWVGFILSGREWINGRFQNSQKFIAIPVQAGIHIHCMTHLKELARHKALSSLIQVCQSIYCKCLLPNKYCVFWGNGKQINPPDINEKETKDKIFNSHLQYRCIFSRDFVVIGVLYIK
jgi:hypothetical protein